MLVYDSHVFFFKTLVFIIELMSVTAAPISIPIIFSNPDVSKLWLLVTIILVVFGFVGESMISRLANLDRLKSKAIRWRNFYCEYEGILIDLEFDNTAGLLFHFDFLKRRHMAVAADTAGIHLIKSIRDRAIKRCESMYGIRPQNEIKGDPAVPVVG